MFDCKQFREQIVRPTLHGLGMWNEYAEELMIGTCAVESQGGTYLVQQNAGPALGIFQMEPKTHDDIWKFWLPNHPAVSANLMRTCMISMKPAANMMVNNLLYACAMARIHYFRDPYPILEGVENQAALWKRVYNTIDGKGTIDDYINAYNAFVGRGSNGSKASSKRQDKRVA